jgi:hypothetical protein
VSKTEIMIQVDIKQFFLIQMYDNVLDVSCFQRKGGYLIRTLTMIYEPSTYSSKWRRSDKNNGVRSLLKNLNLLRNYRTHRRYEKMIYTYHKNCFFLEGEYQGTKKEVFWKKIKLPISRKR